MEKPKRRKGCRGCLTVVLVVALVLVAWVAAMRWGVLEKLGLRQPVSERVFALPPDREAATALLGMLQQGGMNTQGVDLHVLPMAGHEGSVAILTLDASQGFDLERWFSDVGDEGVDNLFDEGALRELNVTRLAFDYVNGEGKSIVTLTAPVEALRQTSEGGDEKGFLKALMGRIDVPGLIREVTP